MIARILDSSIILTATRMYDMIAAKFMRTLCTRK